MKNNSARFLHAAVLSAVALTSAAQASLVHRYSFSEQPEATTTKDSVGTADGVIKGNGAYFDGAGHLSLPGGTSSNAGQGDIAGYVDLPNHIINVLTNVSFETWVTWDQSGSSAWQRIFDFGTSSGGEDISNGDGNYLFFSPQGDANLRFAVRDPITGVELSQTTGPAPLASGTEVCLTITYDYDLNIARLYSNAVLQATSKAPIALKSINDVNNWLGRSQWGDPMFMGTYNEFRIYDTALTPQEVGASYLSGPATPSTDPVLLGTLDAVHLTIPKTDMTEQDTQNVVATVDYQNVKALPLGGVVGATYQSDKPSVLTVDAKGTVTAASPGTAKVTLAFGGKTDSVTVTVKARQTGLTVAGTLYVDLRASDLKTGDTTTWPNRAGTGDFTSAGEATYVADVVGTGVAGIQFASAGSPFEGPATPSDLDGGSDSSIEVWAYNPALADEETLVAWGRRGGPDGSNMSFNYGANATYGAVGHWGSPDMGWNGSPPAGQWHYLVYTYDGVNTARVYSDGALKYEETFSAPLAIHAGFPIRIAAQTVSAGDGYDAGQEFTGYLAMVRVHGGQLSAVDIANNFLFGPNLVDPGALESISLQSSYDTLYGVRDFATATVKADYANRKGMLVTAFSTLTSSDPSTITVDAAGTLVALKEGSAVITATYKGKSATKTVQVVAPPALALKHRYSFGEAAGSTTTKDSVGTADGQIKGTGATFDGQGVLSLPGGGSSSATPDLIAGYVDLPNGILSQLRNVSFETWVTWEGSGAWQRIFDFGTSDQGEDISSGNGNYFFLTPQNGGGFLHFSVRDPVTQAEPAPVVNTAALGINEEIYLAITYNFNANVAMMYSNAVLVATNLAPISPKVINDVNNWLGRSQWGDNMFQGKFDEFRIWEGALGKDDVAASYAAGPNTLPVTSPKPTLTVAMSSGKVVIGWPSSAVGFALQSTPALGASAQWTAVDTSTATEAAGQTKLTVTPSGLGLYYRLTK